LRFCAIEQTCGPSSIICTLQDSVFAKAFDKRRTEAAVAFQIRRLREAKGWSQNDLAKKVGCSQQAISAVEQAGYKRHSLPLLRRIAAVLDADVVVALVPRKAA
jgi:DNA-binding XRE family transcriptional regulator